MPRDSAQGGGSNQDQKEKKDHAHHPNGRSENSDFEDPQANQSKGHRKRAASSGGHEPEAQAQTDAGPTNNTTSGGNRPKVPQRTDHSTGSKSSA